MMTEKCVVVGRRKKRNGRAGEKEVGERWSWKWKWEIGDDEYGGDDRRPWERGDRGLLLLL